MDSEHELVNLRMVALGREWRLSAAKVRDYQLWMDGALRTVIYDRERLRAGDRIAGPAIVVEMNATTLIETGCAALVNAFGNILINPA